MDDLVQHALAAQGLTLEDLQANREGRVSPAQLKRLDDVQRGGKAVIFIVLGSLWGFSTIGAIYHFLEHHQPPIFILPAIAITFSAVIYFFVYKMNRLPMPKEIANSKVTVVRGKVMGSIVTGTRGVYLVSIDYVRYSGCSTSLPTEVGTKDRVIDAYVIADRRYAVALVPVG